MKYSGYSVFASNDFNLTIEGVQYAGSGRNIIRAKMWWDEKGISTYSTPSIIIRDGGIGQVKTLYGFGSTYVRGACYDSDYIYLIGVGYPTFDTFKTGAAYGEASKLSHHLYPGAHATIPRGKALRDDVVQAIKWPTKENTGGVADHKAHINLTSLSTSAWSTISHTVVTSDIYWTK
jgi:hypothetical protein